jgi:RNA polymerase subunit RPABC4/transcription elongation factor Spt4
MTNGKRTKLIINKNESEEKIKLCKDCLIEVMEWQTDIDGYEYCPKCDKHNFTTNWGLEIIERIKRITFTEEIIIDNSEK